MKKKLLTLGATICSFSLLFSGVAYAHVTVKPTEVLTGAFRTFTTSVPNEKDIPVTAVRLTIPSNVKSVTPTVKQGWEISTKKSGENISEINWTGGSIDAGLRDDFTFSAQAPDKSGEIVWKAYQTYQDGSVVSWNQKPAGTHDHESEDESKGPYSVTNVSDDEDVDADNSEDGASNVAQYILSGVAVLLSAVALVRSSKR